MGAPLKKSVMMGHHYKNQSGWATITKVSQDEGPLSQSVRMGRPEGTAGTSPARRWEHTRSCSGTAPGQGPSPQARPRHHSPRRGRPCRSRPLPGPSGTAPGLSPAPSAPPHPTAAAERPHTKGPFPPLPYLTAPPANQRREEGLNPHRSTPSEDGRRGGACRRPIAARE